MPYSRRGKTWLAMLVALTALLAFAAQASSTEYPDERDPVGCVSGDYEQADPCSVEEPEPLPESKPDLEEPKPSDGESCGDSHARVAMAGHEERSDDGCMPRFVRRFISRVWKFVGEVDYYESGELSMTLGKILNLPRKFRAQDDELLDQDTTVLVSERVRVFRDGERVGRDALDTANDVRVHGKLLRPRLWRTDEDGSPVPTIRAKKVYITG